MVCFLRIRTWAIRDTLLCVAIGALAGSVSLAQQNDAVDDRAKDLAERLLGEKSEDGDLMQRVLERMSQAEERLAKQYDAGLETQALQRLAIEELELAIKSAARGKSSGKGASSAGDKRRKSGRPAGKSESNSQPSASGAETEAAQGEADAQAGSARGPLRETRRGWGHLPPRDRDEIIQGSREQSLDAYREWIERYYRALSDEGDE